MLPVSVNIKAVNTVKASASKEICAFFIMEKILREQNILFKF
jgi:hypothetical protein